MVIKIFLINIIPAIFTNAVSSMTAVQECRYRNTLQLIYSFIHWDMLHTCTLYHVSKIIQHIKHCYIRFYVFVKDIHRLYDIFFYKCGTNMVVLELKKRFYIFKYDNIMIMSFSGKHHIIWVYRTFIYIVYKISIFWSFL